MLGCKLCLTHISNLYHVYLQLVVEAFDTYRPDKRGTGTVLITVLRNPNLPSWQLPQYSAKVREDAPVLTEVLQVQATDKDVKVSSGYK